MGNERVASRSANAPDALFISTQLDRSYLDAQRVYTNDTSLTWGVEIDF